MQNYSFLQITKYHLLKSEDFPVSEVESAHMDKTWQERATQEVITLLRDDYPTLMSVLGALSDI